ncbi:MAG TPA: YozE family protein [Polyangiaceae bacterium]
MATLVGFHEWLGKQKGLRTPVGEFARTALRDANFPREVASLDALLEYVRGQPNGSAQTVAIARTAYRTYERSVQPPSRI